MSDFTETLDAEARKCALNMIALWAARQLGKSGEDADEFARDFIADNASSEQQQHLFDKLSRLLREKGTGTKDILQKVNEFSAVAQACFSSFKNDCP